LVKLAWNGRDRRRRRDPTALPRCPRSWGDCLRPGATAASRAGNARSRILARIGIAGAGRRTRRRLVRARRIRRRGIAALPARRPGRAAGSFRLLAGLRAERLPVPVPLLAGYWRRGLHYGAAILVERIPGARALAAWLDTDADAAPWEAVGAMLADFHRAGLDHADLNAHNILVDGDGRPWLIDFDRSRRRAAGAWRQSNLERLARSLAKLSDGGDRWRPGFARLQGAYEHAMAGAPA
jgi:3-deoxy-D-manno-octulosonic acid kinase